jgi:glycosyltransferase involved in cell wall biosynthesis
MGLNGQSTAVLIIPALNEADVIASTLSTIPPGLFRHVIVADNGSTDDTAEIARRAGAVVVREPERGYGAACLRALQAVPEGTTAVAFLQADGSEDPSEAVRLLAPIYDGRADLVIGSRTSGVCEPGALLAHQAVGNRVATTLIRALYGHRFTDLGPFRAIRLEALRRLGMRDRNYGWTVEMQVRALREGLRVIEVPITYRRRLAGENKVSGSFWGSARAGAKILWTVLRLSAGRGGRSSARLDLPRASARR